MESREGSYNCWVNFIDKVCMAANIKVYQQTIALYCDQSSLTGYGSVYIKYHQWAIMFHALNSDLGKDGLQLSDLDAVERYTEDDRVDMNEPAIMKSEGDDRNELTMGPRDPPSIHRELTHPTTGTKTNEAVHSETE